MLMQQQVITVHEILPNWNSQMLAFCKFLVMSLAFFNFNNTKQTLKLITQNSRTVGGPYHQWGPPSLDAAATPSLRHRRYTPTQHCMIQAMYIAITGTLQDCAQISGVFHDVPHNGLYHLCGTLTNTWYRGVNFGRRGWGRGARTLYTTRSINLPSWKFLTFNLYSV